jgi:hypothetical protein
LISDGQCYCDQGQRDASQDRLDHHFPRLPLYLCKLGLILDLLFLAC